ncbi:MAG: hypothetical protein GY928_33665 [Colwellia sp.]|nr:hypothetical protein [Colwellia sp.]
MEAKIKPSQTTEGVCKKGLTPEEALKITDGTWVARSKYCIFLPERDDSLIIEALYLLSENTDDVLKCDSIFELLGGIGMLRPIEWDNSLIKKALVASVAKVSALKEVKTNDSDNK